ncbi:MAG: hypothetical protein KBS74_06725 [Clostridiales bacterium]|nr:hypothetical protein [Candidatus Cacconaster stercorequi]
MKKRTQKLTRRMKIVLSAAGRNPEEYRLHHIDRETGKWVFIHKVTGETVQADM